MSNKSLLGAIETTQGNGNLTETLDVNLDYFRYGNVRVLIAESAETPREAIKLVLFEMGVRNFTITENLHDTRMQLTTGSFDLCILNVSMADESVASTVMDVRQGDLGDDPFLPIIMHAFEPTIEVMQEIVSAGVDAVLTLPMTTKKLNTALSTVTDRRKPFVVTSTYLGPDRRTNPREGTQDIQRITVPNALRRRIKGEEDDVSHVEISQLVRDLKVECYANRIVLNIGKIAGLVACQNAGTLGSWLADLHVMATNLNTRILDTCYRDQQVLCEPLIQIVDQCLESGRPSGEDLAVMQQLALAIEVGFKRDSTSSVEAALNLSTMFDLSKVA